MLPIVSLGLVVCVALGLTACRDGGAAPDDTLPPEVTTSTTAPPSYDVPEVIDVAYVQRVIYALDHVYGDAVRHLARTRVVDEEFLRHLVAIHNPRYFQLLQDLWVKTQASEFERLRAQPDDPVTRIDKLLRADRTCILIQGDRAVSRFFIEDNVANHDRYVALTPLHSDRNPGGLNPTPWTINFSGEMQDGSAPADACDAQ